MASPASPSPGFRPWLLATRPKTLPAALAPVLIGGSWAFATGVFAFWPVLWCGLFAVLIQIGTNYANDYYDFQKGADTETRIGPTRAVAAGLVSPEAMRRAMFLTFALALLAGLLLIPYGGWWLLLIGIVSVLCGIAYTGGPYPLGYNGWGDVFVFLFFGLIATGMTHYVQAGFWSVEIWILGAVPGALATNILVVNNLRDARTDVLVGKRTLVVRHGVTFGERQYHALWAVAFAGPLLSAWWLGSLAPLAPWLLVAWALKLSVLLGRSQGRGPGRWGLLLGGTAGLMMVFALFWSLGLIASRWI